MNLGIPNPAMRKPESNDDRHVIAKHSEIYPSVILNHCVMGNSSQFLYKFILLG